MCDSSDEETKKKASAPPSRQNSQASIDSSCSSFEKIEQDEADNNLFANTLPPITLLGNAIVDTPDPDPRDVPIKPDQEQYYTAATMRAALGNLVFYSVMMFTLPFVTMYLSYHYLFLDYFGLDYSEAILDAGMIGVGTVFFIMAGFCYVAYLEEVEAEKEKFARQAEEEKMIDERLEGAASSGGEEEEEGEREVAGEKDGSGGEKEEREAAGDTAPVATDDESKKDK